MVKLKKIRNGWLLYHASGGYEKHSHFKSKEAAEKCLWLIRKGIMPEQPYFIESCRRVLSNKEFDRLQNKRKKENYININRGLRR